MGDDNASLWDPEQNKIEKLRKQSTPKVTFKHAQHFRKTYFHSPLITKPG